MKFVFGDIVVVEENLIGVVVKTWESGDCEIYVRPWNRIETYPEKDIERYLVRHKCLNHEEMTFQKKAIDPKYLTEDEKKIKETFREIIGGYDGEQFKN